MPASKNDEVISNVQLNIQAEIDVQAQTEPTSESVTENPLTDKTTEPGIDPAASSTSDPPPNVESFLDPELLAALGESTSDSPEFGASIHDSLANLWLPLLKKGLTKDNKEKLLKEYLIPSNCKLLQAPKLNAEISAAVSEIVRGRDKKYVAVQQQLGQGITAVNRAMDVMLKSDNKIEALKHLSDGCRILADLHVFFTKDRIKLISPSLDKSFLHIIQDAERDESLFGTTLSEKIKASKAIEKQGQQIKKTVVIAKANTPNTTSARPSTSQGNWSGPPRYSSNRGGRGGSRKMNPSPAPATRRPYITSTVQSRPPAQNKPRAQAHQQ